MINHLLLHVISHTNGKQHMLHLLMWTKWRIGLGRWSHTTMSWVRCPLRMIQAYLLLWTRSLALRLTGTCPSVTKLPLIRRIVSRIGSGTGIGSGVGGSGSCGGMSTSESESMSWSISKSASESGSESESRYSNSSSASDFWPNWHATTVRVFFIIRLEEHFWLNVVFQGKHNLHHPKPLHLQNTRQSAATLNWVSKTLPLNDQQSEWTNHRRRLKDWTKTYVSAWQHVWPNDPLKVHHQLASIF